MEYSTRVNLFKNYLKKENEHTNAFISFLNFLYKSDPDAAIKLLKKLNLKDLSKNNIRFDICHRQNINGTMVTWDAVIISGNTFYAIECKVSATAFNQKQINRHLKNLEKIKNQKINGAKISKTKLIIISPMTDAYIYSKIKKKENWNDLLLINWNDFYFQLSSMKATNKFKHILDEYKKYLDILFYMRSGVLFTLSDFNINKEVMKKILIGKEKFHIPKILKDFNIPNFNVFIFKDDGILFHFESNILSLNKKRDKNRPFGKNWTYNFEIKDKKIFVFSEEEPFTRDETIKLLDKENKKLINENKIKPFKSWKNRGFTYRYLTKDNVDSLKNELNYKEVTIGKINKNYSDKLLEYFVESEEE